MTAAVAAAIFAVVATVAIGGLVYAGRCWLQPFVRCGACNGSGYGPSITRPCRWCKGQTMRLRLGRFVFNYFYDLRKDAVRGRS